MKSTIGERIAEVKQTRLKLFNELREAFKICPSQRVRVEANETRFTISLRVMLDDAGAKHWKTDGYSVFIGVNGLENYEVSMNTPGRPSSRVFTSFDQVLDVVANYLIIEGIV